MGHKVSIMVASSTTLCYVMAASASVVVAAGTSPNEMGRMMTISPASFPQPQAKKPIFGRMHAKKTGGTNARDYDSTAAFSHVTTRGVTNKQEKTNTCAARARRRTNKNKVNPEVSHVFTKSSTSCCFVGPSGALLSSPFSGAASRKRCRRTIEGSSYCKSVLYIKGGGGGSRRDRRLRSNWNLYRSGKCEAVDVGAKSDVVVNSSTALQAVSIPVSPHSSTSSVLLRYNANARRKKRREQLLKKMRRRGPLFQEDAFVKNQELNDSCLRPVSDNDQVAGFATLPVEPFVSRTEHGKIISRKNRKNRTKAIRADKTPDMEETMLVKIPKPSISPHKQSKAEGFAAADVSTLRKLFGTNKNKFWGDLDTNTARQLYHTLLPRALIRLHAQGLTPDELAPLAYEARVAAKQYARERSQIPGRIFAVAYDGFRHLRQYGKWSPTGLTWDELWSKYERQIQEEIQIWDPSLKLEDLTSQVCLRILERSCRTNEMIDRLVIGGAAKENQYEEEEQDSHSKKGSKDATKNKRSAAAKEVLVIASKFDQDVQNLLNQMEEDEAEVMMHHRTFLLRLLFAARERIRSLGDKFQEEEKDVGTAEEDVYEPVDGSSLSCC